MKKRNLKWIEKLTVCCLCLCCALGLASCAAKNDTAQLERRENAYAQTESAAQQTTTEEEFHDRFQSGLEAYFSDGSLVTGDQAVCLEYEDGHEDEAVFTKDHVPEAYLTEEPDEVRYVIRYVKGKTVVGTYSVNESMAPFGGDAYRLWALVSIEDLKTGETLDQMHFTGSEPPDSIEVEYGRFGGSASGDPPDEKEIELWVIGVIRKVRQAEAAEKTEALLQPNQSGEEALKAVQKVMDQGWNSYETVVWALEREGFTHEAAVYAADNCGVDWKEEALKDARGATAAGFSEEEVLAFLQSSGFTDEEIAYAMENCGID